MKELSIEEKAKAYDEALKVLHKYDGANIMFTQDLKEEMFPELAESEDERIRKELIEFVKSRGGFKQEYIAWLEKQGEHKKFCDSIQVGDKVTRNPNGVLVNLSQLNRVAKKKGEQKSADTVEPKFKIGDVIRHKKQGFTCKITAVDTEYRVSECNGTHLPFDSQDYYELVEQKLADKTEPKFHDGEWVFIEEVKGYKQGPFQIKSVDEFGYNFDEYHIIPSTYEELLSKWTIQDAKDGDVLEYQGEIFIIRELKKKVIASRTIEYYCCYDGEHFINNSIYSLMDDDLVNIYPSTQEQHNLLFQKMKESGYEWDAEKKELKKIEQKPSNVFNIYEKSLLEKFKQAVYDCAWGKVTCKSEGETQDEYVERWTEQLLSIVRDWADNYIDSREDAIRRRSFDKGKYSMQKHAWSEEDESLCMQIKGLLNVCQTKSLLSFDLYKKMCDLLKSLKDRVQPQPKQEWSKEDEEEANYIADFIENLIKKEKLVSKKTIIMEEMVDWLRSLRPPYYCDNCKLKKSIQGWKPSDEQIIALRWVLNNIPYNKHKEEISGLLDQIKEL